MQREVILTDLAPTPIGNYSQAIKCGKTVYLSGQIAINPQTREPHDTTIETRSTRCLPIFAKWPGPAAAAWRMS